MCFYTCYLVIVFVLFKCGHSITCNISGLVLVVFLLNLHILMGCVLNLCRTPYMKRLAPLELYLKYPCPMRGETVGTYCPRPESSKTKVFFAWRFLVSWFWKISTWILNCFARRKGTKYFRPGVPSDSQWPWPHPTVFTIFIPVGEDNR